MKMRLSGRYHPRFLFATLILLSKQNNREYYSSDNHPENIGFEQEGNQSCKSHQDVEDIPMNIPGKTESYREEQSNK